MSSRDKRRSMDKQNAIEARTLSPERGKKVASPPPEVRSLCALDSMRASSHRDADTGLCIVFEWISMRWPHRLLLQPTVPLRPIGSVDSSWKGISLPRTPVRARLLLQAPLAPGAFAVGAQLYVFVISALCRTDTSPAAQCRAH